MKKYKLFLVLVLGLVFSMKSIASNNTPTRSDILKIGLEDNGIQVTNVSVSMPENILYLAEPVTLNIALYLINVVKNKIENPEEFIDITMNKFVQMLAKNMSLREVHFDQAGNHYNCYLSSGAVRTIGLNTFYFYMLDNCTRNGVKFEPLHGMKVGFVKADQNGTLSGISEDDRADIFQDM